MNKLYTFSTMILVSLLFLNCKSEKKSQNFQNEYNDQLQFEMTDSYRKKQAAFFDKNEKDLASIDTTSLSDEEKNSYDIIKWETEVGQQLLKQNANLMPVHQFWGTHLTMGQFAGGTSAQPFKTEKDYTNFLKRMEIYAVWVDSALVYMKKGIQMVK